LVEAKLIKPGTGTRATHKVGKPLCRCNQEVDLWRYQSPARFPGRSWNRTYRYIRTLWLSEGRHRRHTFFSSVHFAPFLMWLSCRSLSVLKIFIRVVWLENDELIWPSEGATVGMLHNNVWPKND